MTLGIPFLPEPGLRAAAHEFLARHHPGGAVPVPIEEIIEFGLRLDIIPVPGLIAGHRGINGYLAADSSAIYVDDGLFRFQENRYLFTLAHEIAHLVLHSHLYQGFTSEEEWLRFRQRITHHELSKAEYQANTFAGLVLVPPEPLRDVATHCFRSMAERVLAEAPGFDLSSDAFWSYVAEDAGPAFRVAPITARIRLQNDGLWGTVL